MSRSALVTAGLALALTTACASTGEQRSSSAAGIITEAEISGSTASNAYDLVQNLRPRWLNTRGQQSLGTVTRATPTGPVAAMERTTIAVYVDGARMGELDQLRSISARDIATIRRLSAGEATQRFGGDHPHGAILVSTK
jgi:hypothetical protein